MKKPLFNTLANGSWLGQNWTFLLLLQQQWSYEFIEGELRGAY